MLAGRTGLMDMAIEAHVPTLAGAEQAALVAPPLQVPEHAARACPEVTPCTQTSKDEHSSQKLAWALLYSNSDELVTKSNKP
mmetsp:Transcript_32349/g.58749  ORF Transcript_32349/g.58749 Transcript_32349/m.58749 type:complete len:82 (+) Transcript_32349:2171-2416(+)